MHELLYLCLDLLPECPLPEFVFFVCRYTRIFLYFHRGLTVFWLDFGETTILRIMGVRGGGGRRVDQHKLFFILQDLFSLSASIQVIVAPGQTLAGY